MKFLYSFLNRILNKIQKESRPDYPNIHPTAYVGNNVKVVSPKYLIMEEHTSINGDAVIMNGPGGEFIIKKNSRIAIGLIATSGNHMPVVGMLHREVTDEIKAKLDVAHEYTKPIIINEDVWIGSRVTLTQGISIGRGAVVGTGSVVRTNVPPYAMVMGNPAKIIGFKFTPAEILEHEQKLYQESERLSEEMINDNYKKYFLTNIKEIKKYSTISL